MTDYTRTPNYNLYKPVPDADFDIWGDHLNANADTLDGLIRIIDQRGSGAGVILAGDYLSAGQPDGITDNTAQLQDALDAAAGVTDTSHRERAPGAFTLLVPAAPFPYVAAGLVIPAHTHLIIEAGATLRLPNAANTSMFFHAGGATGVLIELYGTLDGNAAGQSLTSSQVSGGCINTGNDFLTHSAIVGDRRGLITNFVNWPLAFGIVTDVVISGVSMTNSALSGGGSPSFAGQVQRPTTSSPHIVSGSYTGTTGMVSLTTNVAHGIVPGEEFSPIALAGTGGFGNAGVPANPADPDDATKIANTTGTGAIFVALSGTAGTALVYQANAGGANGTITAGYFDRWSTPVATIASGTYTAANAAGTAGVVSITTTAPHGLVYGQRIMINATAGAAAASATGVFVLLEGTSGITLFYNTPSGGTSGTITSGTVSLSTKSYSAGFADCYVDNIDDFGIALYGGCENCFIRNCEVTRTNGGGPSIYSDKNNGRNVNCEISGCYVHNTYSTGIVIATNDTAALHQNCRVTNNYVTHCVGGAGVGSVDGLQFSNNVLYANRAAAVGPGFLGSAELLIETPASRINVIGNTIRDAGGGGALAPVLVPVTGGTYDSATGNVSLTRAAGLGTNLFSGCVIVFANATGTGAVASLNGMWTATTGTSSTTINFKGPAGLGAVTISGGQAWPAVYGILLYLPGMCRIFGNHIGDYQSRPTMAAALGGQWGPYGRSEGNSYGPQFFTAGNFPADQSVYQLYSQQGMSYDAVTGVECSTTPVTLFAGNNYPPQGLALGWNRSLGSPSGPGRGETDFFLGASQATPGGFDFIKVITIHAVSGTYNSTTGAVSLLTNVAHGLTVGASFTLSLVLGTDTTSGADLAKLNASWIATTGTGGTTLNFNSGSTGLTITSITNGSINANTTDGGIIDVSAGLGGSLLANDGYGNLRIGGALVHGSMQSYPLVNSGTVTIQPNTSFVLVQNGASIATGRVVLPIPQSGGQSFPEPALGGHNELEINFQNPVGALTVVAGGTLTLSGAPTSIAAAGTSINFIQVGSVWQRRIMA